MPGGSLGLGRGNPGWVPSIIVALLEPSIKSAGPDIVFTLASTNVIWKNIFDPEELYE